MSMVRGTLKHSELTGKIIGVFYDVYNELGHGFLESTYAAAMLIALEESGIEVAREVAIPVSFHGKTIGPYFADMVVERRVLLELKPARCIESAHETQLLHYLRATDIESACCSTLGCVRNFVDCFSTMTENGSVEIRVNRWPRS
jgi:GxxExxY protein